jgi:chromosome segregation ATPase
VSELAKAEAAEKIASLFRVSSLEAVELIEAAPVILLEDVPFDAARQVKESLQVSGVDILLSDDPLEKRRCFQVFWPERPKLKLGETVLAAPSTTGPDGQLGVHDDGSSGKVSSVQEPERPLGRIQKEFEELREKHELFTREWKEREAFLNAELKSVRSEKENLLQAIEALRLKNKLLARESSNDLASRGISLDVERRSYEERVKSLEKEYEVAEVLWREKFQERERQERQRFLQFKELQSENSKLKEQVASLENKCSELDGSFQKWRKTQGTLGETQKAKIEELGSRNLQLEEEILYARGKIKGLAEDGRLSVTSERKVELKKSLKEKELLLRELVHRQEAIEKRLKEAEKDLKSVLAEQEQIEEAILEGHREV